MTTTKTKTSTTTKSFLKKKAPPPPTLDQFPEELLLKVFARLPVGDRHRCAFVCRRWRRIAQDDTLWRPKDGERCPVCGGGQEGGGGKGGAAGAVGGEENGVTVKPTAKKKQSCSYCGCKLEASTNANSSNNAGERSTVWKDIFVEACRKRRAQMLKPRLKVATVFSRHHIGVLLRDFEPDFEMWMTKKIGKENLVFRAEKKDCFHHGLSTTVRFLNIDLPPLSSVSSIRFVVLLPLFLSEDYAQKFSRQQRNTPASGSAPAFSSSTSPLTQRACIARLSLADLESPVESSADSSSSSASPSTAPIDFKILQNRSPFAASAGENGEEDILRARNASSTLLAFWRDVDEKTSVAKEAAAPAFVSLNLHHNRLLPLCLRSTLRRLHDDAFPTHAADAPLEPHRPYVDDLDPKFGLHGFDCVVDLRHQRKSLWQQMFQGIFCREQLRDSDDYIPLCLIRPSHNEDSVILPEAVSFPWKTELFVGRIPNLGILDIAVRDEFKKVIFDASSPIVFRPLDRSNATAEGYFLDMNIGSGSGFGDAGDEVASKVWRGIYSGDARGEIVMDICDKYEFGEYRTKVVNMEIRLKKKFVNKWFGTKY